MAKKSKAGARHVKKVTKAARRLLRGQAAGAGSSRSLSAGSSPLSRLKPETDPAAVARVEEWLRRLEKMRQSTKQDRRQLMLDAARLAQDMRRIVLCRRSG